MTRHVIQTFSAKVREASYRPPIGLEAAMTAQRACSDVTMPALDTEILCCSIASWMLVLSASFIYNTLHSSQLHRQWLSYHIHRTDRKTGRCQCKNTNSKQCIAVSELHHTATGNHMPYGITWCYLPPGSGDFPAFTPAEAGTQFSDPRRDARLSWPRELATLLTIQQIAGDNKRCGLSPWLSGLMHFLSHSAC